MQKPLSKQTAPPLKRGFRGGVYIPADKGPANDKHFEPLQATPFVLLPLRDGEGGELIPCVAEGERVLAGQAVALSGEGGEPLLSSVAGTVTAIGDILSESGETLRAITVTNDFTGEYAPLGRSMDWQMMEREEIIELIRAAQICDGDRPLAELLEKTTAADTLVIQALDTSPYKSSVRRAAIDLAEELAEGIHVLLRALGRARCFIAVDRDDEEVHSALKGAVLSDKRIRIMPMESKYPLDDYRVLASCFSGHRLGSVLSVKSCVVVGAYAAAAVARAAVAGEADVRRMVTVGGSAIANPKNLLVPIGTPLSALVSACGGYLRPPRRLTAGDALTGRGLFTDSVPVGRATCALLAFAEDAGASAAPCINCGRCADVCPAGLMPSYIYRFYACDAAERCAGLHMDECISCAACAYACPAALPLMQVIETLKNAAVPRGKGEKNG